MDTLQQLILNNIPDCESIEAVKEGPHSLSYKAFRRRIFQLVHGLLEQGVRKGDRIALLSKNDSSAATVLFAALSIGAVVVPLSWQLRPYELKGLLKACSPKALFYGSEFRETITAVRAALSEVQLWVETGAALETSPQFEALCIGAGHVPDVDRVTPEDAALLMFTSGTTARPKRCLVTHGSTYRYLTKPSGLDGVNPHTRLLACHPMYHTTTLAHLLSAPFERASVVFASHEDPDNILRVIEAEKVQSVWGFPALFTQLLDAWNKEPSNLSSLELVFIGGTKTPASLIRRFLDLGVPIMTGYGSSEAWGISTWMPAMGLRRLASAGKPLAGVQVKVEHPDTREELPAGEIGEIVVRSPYLFQGYDDDSEATANAMRNGWFRTGDSGYLDAEGFVYITGRYKDLILHGGDNIYPEQVEEVIQQLDGVLESAVVGVPDPVYGQRPKAFVVTSGSQALSETGVQQYCKERLSAFKVPEIEFVPCLPKTALGKVRKNVLRERA